MAKGKILFETKDINLAAFMHGVKDYVIADVKQQGDRVLFIFHEDDSRKRREDVLEFYNNVGGFLKYTDAWKNLKNFLHNIKKDA